MHVAPHGFRKRGRSQELALPARFRSDLKWIALQDASGVGMEVVGEKPANGSVMPKGWSCISRDAAVAYSSKSKWAVHPDTLLTTQESPFAFHTEEEKEPWLVIDLKSSSLVCGVTVLNRDDQQGSRPRNLHIWVSKDKTNWKKVFSTTGAKDEWLVKLDSPEPARYVKVGMLNGEVPEFFHLKGIRVFASEER